MNVPPKQPSRQYLSCLVLALLYALTQPALAQQPAPAVEVATVTESQSSSVVRLPGTVISKRDAEISAELNGRLQWVAEVGDQIALGDPLAVIDDHLLQLQLRNDQAQLARISADIAYNQRQIKRLQRLAEKNNTARSELDEVESRTEMLRQDLHIAEVNRDRTLYDIDRTRVTAPFAGIVVSRAMTTGEYTQTGSALVRLVDTQSLEISVNAPLRVARYNQPGTRVQVETEEKQLLTAIRGVIPVGDPRSRMMELRLQLQPGNGFIGEAVTVELPDGEAETSLSIPRDALVLRSEQIFVYSISDDNKAVKIPVIAGAGRGSRIAILGDLKIGDSVVIRGGERLREGQEVRVIEHQLAVSN